jgi:hypothetical protein
MAQPKYMRQPSIIFQSVQQIVTELSPLRRLALFSLRRDTLKACGNQGPKSQEGPLPRVAPGFVSERCFWRASHLPPDLTLAQ